MIHPDLFHGHATSSKKFFEGWYIKLTSTTGVSYAFILGLCRGENPHTFIQMVDSAKSCTEYFTFEYEDFQSDSNRLCINIAENSFSHNKLTLALSSNTAQVLGTLHFEKLTRWDDNALLPGSMGAFNHLNFLECYTQVCILDGLISGSLWIDGKKVDFTGGSVYMEKNWGKSFPAAWFWCQSNDFKDKRAAFTLSYGRVPFMGAHFDGLISALVVDGKIYKFTTMNTSIIKLQRGEKKHTAVMISPQYIATVTVTPKDTSKCIAPSLGNMSASVEESISSQIKVMLYRKKDKFILYNGTATNAGIELGGLWSDISAMTNL